MLVSELLEIILQDNGGIHHIRSLTEILYLEQKTFPEIPRANT